MLISLQKKYISLYSVLLLVGALELLMLLVAVTGRSQQKKKHTISWYWFWSCAGGGRGGSRGQVWEELL